MIDWPRTIRTALVSGSCASAASALALAAAGLAEGKAAVQPINATSHWLNGKRAGSFQGIDAAHTAVGYATNHAACVFWAVIFQAWRAQRHPASPMPMLEQALAMSVVAAAVDYGPTPKRFTPGWELVLSKMGMAFAYGGMAAGLAAGALLTQSKPLPARPGTIARNPAAQRG